MADNLFVRKFKESILYILCGRSSFGHLFVFFAIRGRAVCGLVDVVRQDVCVSNMSFRVSVVNFFVQKSVVIERK